MMKKKSALLYILLMIAVLILGTLAVVPFLTTGGMLDLRLDYEDIDAADYGVTAENVTLTTDDGLRLAAYFVEAESPEGAVVLVSGMHNPPVRDFLGFAKMFQDNGFSTLLVEMRSHGDSEGFGISMGMNEWMDVKAGAEYIEALNEYKDLPIIAYGTSMGAGTVIITGAKVEAIDAVISASAFTRWSDLVAANLREMGAPEWYITIQKPFFDLHMGLKYGLNKMQYTPINQMKHLNKPILLMHSEGDTQVPFSSLERLRQAALSDPNADISNIYIYTLEGDYHFICREDLENDPRGDKEFSQAVLGFLERIGE